MTAKEALIGLGILVVVVLGTLYITKWEDDEDGYADPAPTSVYSVCKDAAHKKDWYCGDSELK